VAFFMLSGFGSRKNRISNANKMQIISGGSYKPM
jgi:hypothetical protein